MLSKYGKNKLRKLCKERGFNEEKTQQVIQQIDKDVEKEIMENMDSI